jgi:hypothetical protein
VIKTTTPIATITHAAMMEYFILKKAMPNPLINIPIIIPK